MWNKANNYGIFISIMTCVFEDHVLYPDCGREMPFLLKQIRVI